MVLKQRKSMIWRNIGILLLFLVLSCVYTIPVILNGEAVLKYLNDGPFHLSRMLSLANIWQSPTNFNYFNHTGVPMGGFYPWLFLYPMYWIYQCVGSLSWSYYLYCAIVTFVTLVIAYYCSQKIVQSSRFSILFAVMYTFSTYRASDIYYRHSMGEIIAMMFLPLILLGIYQIFYTKAKKWKALAIGMGCMAYSHILSLFMAGILVGAFLVIQLCRRAVHKSTWWALMKATALGTLLSIGSLGPILIYTKSTALHLPDEHILQYEVPNAMNLLTDSVNNLIGPTMSATIGIVVLVAFIIGMVLWKGSASFAKDSLALAALFLVMSTTLFPWQWFQDTPLKELQFPWRLLMLATPLIALSFVMMIQRYSIRPIYLSLFILLIIGLHSSTIAHYAGGQMGRVESRQFAKAQLEEKYTDQQLATMVTGNLDGIVGQWDYSPKKARDNKNFFIKHRVLVNGEEKSIEYQYTDNQIVFHVPAQRGDWIVLPVYRYLGERVSVNQTPVKSLKAKHGGTRVMALRDGMNRIQITYHYPKSVLASYAVSLMTLIGTIGYCIVMAIRNKMKNKHSA